jgi:uncharacterized protein (DUF433 family)
MRGQPCVRDLRFPVSSVVAMVADGMTTAEITADHPDLEPEDIVECLRYAAVAVQMGPSPTVATGEVSSGLRSWLFR